MVENPIGVDIQSIHLFPFLEGQNLGQGAAALYLLSQPVLPLVDIQGPVGHLHRHLLGNDDDTTLVTHYPVTGPNDLAAANDLCAEGQSLYLFPEG